MGKLLLFVAFAIVGWLLYKGLLGKPNAGDKKAPRDRPEKMVQCEICGVYMPETDSAQLDGKRTCRAPQQCLHRQSA